MRYDLAFPHRHRRGGAAPRYALCRRNRTLCGCHRRCGPHVLKGHQAIQSVHKLPVCKAAQQAESHCPALLLNTQPGNDMPY